MPSLRSNNCGWQGGGILLTGQALEPKRGIQESKEADGEGYSQKKEGLSSIPVWKASRSLGKSRHGTTSEKDVVSEVSPLAMCKPRLLGLTSRRSLAALLRRISPRQPMGREW